MIVGIKDVFKLVGMIIISACAVFVSTLFLNYNLDLKSIEPQITAQIKPLFDAQKMTGTVVSAVSGGCLLITAAVMLAFYIKHYIDAHRRELGILKALGYGNFKIARGFRVFGSGVFVGTAIGFSAAHCIMPIFYETQNADGLLPEFGAEFHIGLLLALVLLPTLVFAAASVLYGLIKLKAPVTDMLKGKADKVKAVRVKDGAPFLKEMRSVTLKSRRSLVFLSRSRRSAIRQWCRCRLVWTNSRAF